MKNHASRAHNPLIVLAVACAGSLAFAFSSVMAQPAGAEGDYFIHEVEQGDTLLALAQRYTSGPSNWVSMQALNQVAEPRQLPIGRELRIPFTLIPERPARATVVHTVGRATVNDAPLRMGAQVAEGDVIRTEARSFVTLALADDSTVSVPADSVVQVERLQVFRNLVLTDSIFNVRRGAVESHVAPARKGVGRFEVRTPLNITGVRGTRLRVRATETGAQSEVVTGRARVRASERGSAMLRTGQGAATDAAGALLGVRPLLPVPVLGVPVRQGGGWQLDFEPVPGATAYLLRVAGDEEGTRLYSSQRIVAPPASFTAPGAGTYHVLVRAIDADGVMGEDAARSFLGGRALRSGAGLPVLTSSGSQVALMDY